MVLDESKVVEERPEAGDMALLTFGDRLDKPARIEGKVPVFAAVVEDDGEDLGHFLERRLPPFGRDL